MKMRMKMKKTVEEDTEMKHEIQLQTNNNKREKNTKKKKYLSRTQWWRRGNDGCCVYQTLFIYCFRSSAGLLF